MLLISFGLMYLAIKKGFEPLLLLPIAFGMFLANLPMAGLAVENGGLGEGLLNVLYTGVRLELFPPLIFLGIGCMTDFGPLIANPKSFLLGAAAQGGIFAALIGAAALMRPSKSVKDMELKSLKKKYKSKGFAAGCSREVIERGAEQLGWELDKLLTLTLQAMAENEDAINAEMA